jgi:hypothetical protein
MVRHRFRNWAGTFDAMSELRVESDALRALWLENTPPPKPWFQLYLEGVSPARGRRKRSASTPVRQRDRRSEAFRLGL